MIAVEVENLSKRFRRQTVQPYTTIKSAIVDVFRRRRRSAEAETFEVLSGITFSVQQGQTLSIIGRNGSGKSTLLKVLAGIYRADHGRVRVHGRIGALLELGTGFHPEFSGRENVFIGVWRILYMAQIERKETSVYAMDAKPTRTSERIFPCSSSLYTIRPHCWLLCVAYTSV